MFKTNKLAIVVPCYFEEEVLPETTGRLLKILEILISSHKIDDTSVILFVNDGSTDATWPIIEKLSKENRHVKGINLSKNFGHQAAVLAGLTVASKDSDMIISIDADLQDDVNAIIKMVDEYHKGFDLVYGVRDNRDTDTFFKKTTAKAFYKMMTLFSTKTVENHADFRLMSQRAVEKLLDFPEENIFLRGMVTLVGYPSTSVYYKRNERFAGESKYPLKKMISFAFDGITSFSNAPLKWIMGLGIVTTMFAICFVLYAVIQHFRGDSTEGWSSIVGSIWLLGGVQLVSVAVIGQYIGKIFTEVKKRPRFIIQDNLYGDGNQL